MASLASTDGVSVALQQQQERQRSRHGPTIARSVLTLMPTMASVIYAPMTTIQLRRTPSMEAKEEGPVDEAVRGAEMKFPTQTIPADFDFDTRVLAVAVPSRRSSNGVQFDPGADQIPTAADLYPRQGGRGEKQVEDGYMVGVGKAEVLRGLVEIALLVSGVSGSRSLRLHLRWYMSVE